MEPSTPTAAPDAFEVQETAAHERPESRTSILTMTASKRWQRWRRPVGLLLLAVTVFLWTASNFLASNIFADNTYSKPYLVTYINTSFFIIPLIPILLHRLHKHPEDVRNWWATVWPGARGSYAVLGDTDSAGAPLYSNSLRSTRTRTPLVNPSEEQPPSTSMTDSCDFDSKRAPIELSAASTKLNLRETARLSLEFCILWFLANYFVAACLEYTTVASSTILTSTSSVFTLLFGTLFRVERFTLRKLVAVLAALAGVALISSVDFSGQNTDDEHRGDFPEKSFHEVMLGDALAFLSAVLYGIYAVFMKKRIADESRVNMPMFFGLVGLFNVLLLWPGIIILHFTGVETFELFPSWSVTAIILCNSAASLVSDLAWAYAVLLTSPIVVTVGLSMTIPLSLVGQIVLNGQTVGWLYWVGATMVILSFVFVSQEEEEKEQIRAISLDDSQGPGEVA
ncbi:hypothetical protein LTR62_000147 [Meristemomyces frigidus]|uniref:DUF3955 domain-containing protein n=1 Tax=Meristemomyces frigidus TaxID=1508187 RepID=A0AAN7TQX7_9PEZI|nr:hypothetical protein LTR62_000147 [Meristemomyces frigidus]